MLVSAAMNVPRKLSVVVATAVVTLMVWAGTASAQVIVDPVDVSERNDGGWVYWIAIALGALGLLLVIFLTIQYMRYAPRFSKDEEGLRVVRADRVRLGRELPRRNVDLSQAAPARRRAAGGAGGRAGAGARGRSGTGGSSDPGSGRGGTRSGTERHPLPAAAEAPAAAPAEAPAPAPAAPAVPRSGPRSRWTRRRTRRP